MSVDLRTTSVEHFVIEVRIDPKSGLDREEVIQKVLEAARNLAVPGCQAVAYNTDEPDGLNVFFERFPD